MTQQTRPAPTNEAAERLRRWIEEQPRPMFTAMELVDAALREQTRITVERLARELAFAAEEVRQSLLVFLEHRDASPDEVWTRITDFQREQWTIRAQRILDEVAALPPEPRTTGEE